MSQTAFTIRLDSGIKSQFDSLCEDFGMSAATAINIFVRTVVRKRRIPFPIETKSREEIIKQGLEAYSSIRKKAMSGELPDLTLDEINEEIRLSREESK